MSEDTSTSWLNSLLGTASQLGSAYLGKPAATTPKPAATTAPATDWTKIAIIGGAALAVITLLLVVFKR